MVIYKEAQILTSRSLLIVCLSVYIIFFCLYVCLSCQSFLFCLSFKYLILFILFRQPVLEGLGWVTHWFYLPMALLIPTSQMLVHAEFNFIYQFLIHTELIGDMGFFGLVLNTASHHRVHHGANRYCLDKNYGGWLCVWDRYI